MKDKLQRAEVRDGEVSDRREGIEGWVMSKKSKDTFQLPRPTADYIGVCREIEPIEPAGDRGYVEWWLGFIGETDERCRSEVLKQCTVDKEARKYYVETARKEWQYHSQPTIIMQ